MKRTIAFSEKALEHMRQAVPPHSLTSAGTPWTWFLLSSVTLFLLALLFWGFYGSMVESVRGTGITLLSGGMRPIVAGGSGTLSHLNIRAGSQVFADQIVGQIYNSERLFTVRRLEAEYARLTAEVAFMQQGSERMTARIVDTEREKIQHLEQLAELQKQSKQRAGELGDMYASLLKSKVMSITGYYQILDQMVQTELAFLSTYQQVAEVSVSTENHVWQHELKLLELRQRIAQKKAELDLAKQLYREEDWLISSFDGHVMEVLKEEGAYVKAGERIALVGAGQDEGLYLVAFVPAEQGKKIRNGMSAYFSPTAAPASGYGYVRCVVRDVSDTAVNAEMLLSELMNASLAQMMMGKTAVMRVELEMIPDADAISGYSWTSKKGYPDKMRNGVIGQVLINTEYRAPASYIIPALRELLQPKNRQPSEEK